MLADSRLGDFSASEAPSETAAAGWADLPHRLIASDRGSVDRLAIAAAAAAAAAAADATNGSSHRTNSSGVGSPTEATTGGGSGGHSAAALALMWTAAAAIILWTAAGNMTIWATLGRSRRLRSASNYLVANLAVSDFLLGVAVLPLSAAYDVLQHWPFGRVACVGWLLADVFLCTASIWSLLVIAADRYLATFYPHCYRGRRWRRRVALYVTVVWAASLLTSVPPVFGLGDTMEAAYAEPTPGRRVCILFDNVEYVLFSSCMTFYVPSVALLAIYTRIFVEIHRRSRPSTADSRRPLARVSGNRRGPPLAGRRVSAAAAIAAATATAAALSRGGGGPEAASVMANDSAATDGCCEHLMNGSDIGGDSEACDAGRRVPLAFPESFNDLCAVAATAAAAAVESSSSTSEPYSYSEAERFTPFMSPAKVTLISLAEASHNGDNEDSHIGGGCTGIERDTSRRWAPWSPAAARDKRSIGVGMRSAEGERQDGGGGESRGANAGEGEHGRKGGRGSADRRHGGSDGGGGRAASRRRYEVREQRATKVMVTIVICFIACWLPFFVVYTVRSVCNVCVSAGVQTFVIWLGYANSALNPVLYSVFNQEFRDELRRGGCIPYAARRRRPGCRSPCCLCWHRNRSRSSRNDSGRNGALTLSPR